MTFAESLPEPGPWSSRPCFESAPPPAGPAPWLRLHRRGDDGRAAVEQLVAEVYRRHFAARLKDFMPVLVSRCSGGVPCAAAGYRSAAEPLFLERYLPRPIEQMLAEATGQAIGREEIVEIGQFASRCHGEGRRLIPVLARHLADHGFRWAVITATADLRRLFSRLRLAALPLGAARKHRVGDDAALWGSYYRHAPKVLAGDLLVNLARLERGRG